MIERIILDIKHSDDYTDYLFQTAALTNKRIIPIVGATEQEIIYAGWPTTLILRCEGRDGEPGLQMRPVWFNEYSRMICLSRDSYLREDGSIDSTQAGSVRETIEGKLLAILENKENLRDVYRHYFWLLWEKREKIYEDPRLFYVSCGLHNKFSSDVPLGVMLKAIEQHPDLFRMPKEHKWHKCAADMMLIDFQYEGKTDEQDSVWRLYRWCPDCHLSTSVTIRSFSNPWFQVKDLVAWFVDRKRKTCDKGQGRSPFTVFDVIDRLSIIK